MGLFSACSPYISRITGFRRYAAILVVGTSFIFSRMNARSSSVTQNLICTVRFNAMPTLFSVFIEGLGYFPTSIFNRRAAAQEGENTGKGIFSLCLLRKFFLSLPTTPQGRILPNRTEISRRKKSCSVHPRAVQK